MSKTELDLLLFKIAQLQLLKASLDKYPNRVTLLSQCETHDEVVALAKSWGFEIGRRWGDTCYN